MKIRHITNLVAAAFLVVVSGPAQTAKDITVEPVRNAYGSGSAGLFVGINEFSDRRLNGLQFAVNDAVGMAHLFVEELQLIPAENCVLAVAGEPTAEASGMYAALKQSGVRIVGADRTALLDELARVCGYGQSTRDLLVLGFSSHGFDDPREVYLMPSNGRIGDELKLTGFPLSHVRTKMGGSRSGKKVLFLDACRSTPERNKSGSKPATAAFDEALDQFKAEAVLTSCSKGQVSWEDETHHHGLFTWQLLCALRGDAKANEQGFITLGSAAEYCAKETDRRARREFNLSQSPAIYDVSLLSLNLPLAIRRQAGDWTSRALGLAKRLSEDDKLAAGVRRSAAQLLAGSEDDAQGQRMVKTSEQYLEGSIDEFTYTSVVSAMTRPSNPLAVKPPPVEEPVQPVVMKPPIRIPEAVPPREKPQRLALPADLVEVSGASYARLTGLAAGSEDAQANQRAEVAELGLPLEVKSKVTGIAMRLIPAGQFSMGDTRESVLVTLSQGFYCGTYEVTQGEWEQVMGENPSRFKRGYVLKSGFLGMGKEVLSKDTSTYPVETVSWEDCQIFLKALCAKEGVAEGTYRLLTEAEWEYACRAGTSTDYYTGEDESALGGAGWYTGNSGNETHAVGGKQSNGYGLYDLHGNVWEWCGDGYGESLTGGADPGGPASGSIRVYRGGSWYSDAGYCRSALRGGNTPSLRGDSLGFRLLRTVP
jgi:formylglycine-generating enzyme required for sulfatase activity/uncharacterized caspase-like protein